MRPTSRGARGATRGNKDPPPAVAASRDYAWLLLAAFQIGLANALSRGAWHPFALGLLLATFASLAWRFFAARGPDRAETAGAYMRWLPVCVLVLGLSLPITAWVHPFGLAAERSAWLPWIRIASLASLASYVPFLGARVESSAIRTVRFAGFAVLLLALGVLAIATDPAPPIDVWAIQTRGVDLLLAGKNPYVWAAVPDTDPENDFTVPYVYPPTALYAGVLGKLLGGDVRYAMLLAVFASGFALRAVARGISRSRAGADFPSILEDAPALFFWQSPIVLFVIELAWIDPIQVFLVSVALALHVAGAAETRTLAAVVLGVAISSKQSMFWLFPLGGIVLGFDRRRWLWSALAALVPVVPFFVWDPRALFDACFRFLSALPPRRDALTFTNALWQWLGVSLPSAAAFVLAAIAVGHACLRRSRSPAGFAEAAVLAYFAFFLFNRWAFANYWFLVGGLCSLAAAASLTPPVRPTATAMETPTADC